MSDEPPKDELNALADKLERISDDLTEFFDAVQIFATKKADDGTGESRHWAVGNGNFYARLGQVHEWLIAEDERIREHMRNKLRAASEDDEDGIDE